MSHYNNSWGWLSDDNPIALSAADPRFAENVFCLFLTQALIIIALCNILGYTAQKLGQPKVVGELLAGVLIGPTAFQNIPHFTQTIFPPASKPFLSLISSFGLVSFLFLVGVETDTDLIVKHWKSVFLITVPPFTASFAVAVGVSKLIYDRLGNHDVAFTTFFVFVGTVMAVTSLSVLSRVLAEMGILSSRLGATTVAAGAANDTLGYCLLAVASSLAGGGKQIFALYQLLAFVAYLLVLIGLWRPFLFWLIKREGIDLSSDSKDRVPRWLILIAVLGGLFSAFISDIFGLHTLVGAFAYGVAIPHGRYGIAVTEAIETPIVSLLLPLYFGAVGLQIDFKTLDSGVTWGLIILLITASFITKAGTTTLFTKLAGMDWRQSMCVGALMQSKGVIEVVIGGIALQDGVIDTRIFSMLFFVFLFTTCTVRPLSRAIYLKQSEKEKMQSRSQISIPSAEGDDSEKPGEPYSTRGGRQSIFGITVALSSPTPSVGALMTLINMLGNKSSPTGDSSDKRPKITLDILRLLPVEYGPASILRLILSHDRVHDGLLQALKTLSDMHSVVSSRMLQAFSHRTMATRQIDNTGDGDILTATNRRMIETLLDAHQSALQRCSDSTLGKGAIVEGLVICPWEAPAHLVSSQSWLGSLLSTSSFANSANLGEDGLAWKATADSQAIPARLFRQRQANTAILVASNVLSHTHSPGSIPVDHELARSLRRLTGLPSSRKDQARRPRVVVPFFGGADDRAAVSLAQLIVQASAGGVDVVIVASQTADALGDAGAAAAQEHEHQSHPVAALRSQMDSTVPTEEQGVASTEDENQDTINLETIHQPEARHQDARFLFQHMGPPLEGVQESTDPDKTDAAEKQTDADVKCRSVDGAHFVSVRSKAERSSRMVEEILSAAMSFVDHKNQSDLVIVGRGKYGSRTAAFRSEIDRLRQYAQAASKEKQRALRHVQRDEAAEIQAMGRTLGSAAEGVLLYGLSDDGETGGCMLVVQAATQSA
ncbi:unnamed protein product [Sympodiomycopsis kandeliae]